MHEMSSTNRKAIMFGDSVKQMPFLGLHHSIKFDVYWAQRGMFDITGKLWQNKYGCKRCLAKY